MTALSKVFTIMACAAVFLPSVASYECALPSNTDNFSLITKGNAEVSAHNIDSGIAIGGQLTRTERFPENDVAVDGESYVWSMKCPTSGPSGFDWNKGINKNVQLSRVIDFDHFEWLAQHAINSTSEDHKIVVLNQGGTFDLDDFRNGGQGEDNGKTLVIFNTPEEVTLTKTQDGRQFGPSVIAPFSEVELKGDAGFVDGFVVAKTFTTSGQNTEQLQMHGDAFTGPIKCEVPVTAPPTAQPTTGSTLPPTARPNCAPKNKANGGESISSSTSLPPIPEFPTDFFNGGLRGNKYSQFATQFANDPAPGSTPTPTPKPTPDPTPAPTIAPTDSPTEASNAPQIAVDDNVETDEGKPVTANVLDNDTHADKEIQTADGGVNGDPHFKTWAGEHFDYHGLCDLVLLENHGFQDDLGMDIHIRTKQIKQWSYISNAVLRIGEDTLEVMGSKTGKSRYWINGAEGDEIKADGLLLVSSLSGYPITFERKNEKQQEFTVDLGDETMIVIKAWNDIVRVDILGASAENFGSSRGLMGKFKTGEHMARDNLTEMKDLNAFGQEWQVQVFEPKLFRILEGVQSPQLCEAPSTVEMRRRLGESLVTQQEAEVACSHVNRIDRDLCIFDVMATNDFDMAGAY